jgi:hypothetical protein
MLQHASGRIFTILSQRWGMMISLAQKGNPRLGVRDETPSESAQEVFLPL